ncbi:Serine/threonine protein kinase [Chitinophaga arvensicola]|uniref:Serine/threonine protein kinase n=2 Tax=Chitinophaga arvensicola TaxID=29529 RepID=A0A1I0S784_9BACT|nr:Serine/threonine protein kinase [Chitinophaga arvensicola]
MVADILKRLMPVIKGFNVPFRLIKDDQHAYALNTGELDFDDIGKFITIYTQSTEQAVEMVKAIEPLTEDYLGAEVQNSLRISKNIYGHWATTSIEQIEQENTTLLSLEVPTKASIPFIIKRKYSKPKNKKWYGWLYLKDKVLRPGPKGDVFLAYSLKGLKIKEVVIKEGRFSVFEDFAGRDIKDRFMWQKKVLSQIGSHVPTARYLDYFTEKENHYLVIENLKGKLLPHKVAELKDGVSWIYLSTIIKLKILDYYIQILSIVTKLHELGYIHRDIQDHNFIVNSEDKVSVIDFELSFNLETNEPEIPFLLGTLGYVAPEQSNLDRPTEKVDMYSLGALLAYLIVGEHPSTLIPKEYPEVLEKINKYSDSILITTLIHRLLNPDPSIRPNMLALKSEIKKYVEDLKDGKIKTGQINVHPYEN